MSAMHRWYRRTTEEQMRGLKVRAVHEMRNAYCSVPVGAVLTISGKAGGLRLKTEPCQHCGVSIFITRVSPDSVELISEAVTP